MSSLLCSGTCATVNVPTIVDTCITAPLNDTGLSFVFLNCDYQFTDITDLAEWQAAVATGDISVAPRGFWGKAIPAQTAFAISCGEVFNTQVGQEFVYESYLVDDATQTDQEFFITLRNNYQNYFVIPFTCTGQFLVADEYVSNITVVGASPGLPFSFVAPPDYEVVSGDNQLIRWAFTLRISTDGIIQRRNLKPIFDYLKTLV